MVRSGSKETVDRLVGVVVTNTKGYTTYSGTIALIFALGGFNIKILVRDGELRLEVNKKLGGGLGLGLGLGLFSH